MPSSGVCSWRNPIQNSSKFRNGGSQARESFCDSFGLMRIMKIYTDRRGILPLEPARFLRDYVPEPVAILLKDLEERHLRSQHGWGPQIFLTHETLLASLDKAIDML